MPLLISEQLNLGPTLPELLEAAPRARPVSKITFDCFGTAEFVERLGDIGRKTILLAGVESHICVTQTALSALKDYRVQVVGDAVSSRTALNRELALNRLRDAGVVVTSTEMAMFELLGQAGTPEFKAVLPLIVNPGPGEQK
jgi:isochorismate hydrolase